MLPTYYKGSESIAESILNEYAERLIDSYNAVFFSRKKQSKKCYYVTVTVNTFLPLLVIGCFT